MDCNSRLLKIPFSYLDKRQKSLNCPFILAWTECGQTTKPTSNCLAPKFVTRYQANLGRRTNNYLAVSRDCVLIFSPCSLERSLNDGAYQMSFFTNTLCTQGNLSLPSETILKYFHPKYLSFFIFTVMYINKKKRRGWDYNYKRPCLFKSSNVFLFTTFPLESSYSSWK